VAGKRFMPLSFVNDRAAEVEPDKKKEDKEDPLLKLLPIQEPRVVSPKEGFRRTPTEEGKRTPFMQMAEKPGDSLRLWQEVQPHYWGIVGQAKPAATPLAYLPDEDKAWKELLKRVQEKWPELKTDRLETIAPGNLPALLARIPKPAKPEGERFVKD